MAKKESAPPEETVTQEQEPAPAQRGQLLSQIDEFDQWLDDIRRNWMQPFFPIRSWPDAGSVFGGRLPRVDVIDRENEFCIRAELPGVNKDNLDVSLQENTVTLRASARQEEQEEKGQYYRRETSRGEFQRTVRLPGTVEAGQAKATFKDGILELIVPKASSFKRQSIKVE